MWKQATGDEALEVLISVIFWGQNLPGLTEARKASDVLHAAFPYVPRRMVDPPVAVEPVLFGAQIQVFTKDFQHAMAFLVGLRC